MQQFFLGLSLSAAFIAGCVAAQLSQLLVPPAHANSALAKWEYYCTENLPQEEAERTTYFNRLGNQGWELVQIYPAGMSHSGAGCFKRPRDLSPSDAIPQGTRSAPAAATPITAPASSGKSGANPLLY